MSRVVKKPLHALAGPLHAVRFRTKKPIAPITLQFECGGVIYVTQINNESTAREIIGQAWLLAHAERGAEQRRRRRETAATKRAAFVEHLKSASRTVKTWPKWKQGLLG